VFRCPAELTIFAADALRESLIALAAGPVTVDISDVRAVDGAGLQPSSKGARVAFKDGKAVVTDGPFAETKELIAGYWIINVKSKAEAIEWAKKIPFKQLPNSGREPEVELRQFFELEDFPNAPPEVVEQERNFGRK